MFKVIGYVAVFFVGWFILWGLGAIVGVFSMPFHAASNTVQMGHDVIDKTLNADNAIYNYEWFKQQKRDIDTAKEQYANARYQYDDFLRFAGPIDKWTFEDKNEAARLRSVVLGLQNQINQRVNDYNARASMANREIFNEGLLPNVLEGAANFLQ